MLKDRRLKIEVLINSPGPHDQVRVRQPFLALQKIGVDCRLHERPFRFNSCIRPHSLVFWQRPLPPSWEMQVEHLQWLRERGCLLLTEWDDHPNLFPKKIQKQLRSCEMAPLVACHAIHSSSAALATTLKFWNIGDLPRKQCGGDSGTTTSKAPVGKIKIFIGNQNRLKEHAELIGPLQNWLRDEPKVKVVIIGDENLAKKIDMQDQIEYHPLLPYTEYRKVLRKCNIALLPLKKGEPERCKTVIKWAEAAAESVAVVAGPELYTSIAKNSRGETTCCVGSDINEIIMKARALSINKEEGRAS